MDEKKQKSLEPSEIVTEPKRVGRRFALSMLGVAGGTALAALGVVGAASRAEAQVTDSDPTDPVCHGRGTGGGVTDSDPSDPAGRGRGREGGAAGISDCDPTDPAGEGRGPQGRTPSTP
ncbi:MAG: hypothetical protein K1X94_03975 [Sandaracinaceae bacterium]|jgi:hypothetical protein|nr:hypothetical protein [Sandaracinaceae bacterium]